MKIIYTILMVLVSVMYINSQELKKIPIPTLFNTGVDNNKMPVADGETDPHYVLSISADPQFSGPDTKVVFSDGFPIGPWLYNDAISKWIAPRADASEWNSPGMYVYTCLLYTSRCV